MRAFVLVILAGCYASTPNYVRYAKLPEATADARALIAARAATAGMTTRPGDGDIDRYVAAVDRKDVEDVTERDKEADGPTVGKGQDRYVLTTRTMFDNGGSLVEITGPTWQSLDLLQQEGRTFHVKHAAFTHHGVHPAATIDGGFAHAPHTDQKWRIDAMTHFVIPVWSRGGEGTQLETRRRISIQPGLGVAIDGAFAVRPEIAITFDRQDALTPMSRLITQGHRKALTLGFSVPFSKEFTAYEGSVTLHIPPHGGIFARAGYETGERSGMTYMAGLRLDAQPTLSIYGGIAAGLLIYVLARYVDWDELTKCNKNNPCE